MPRLRRVSPASPGWTRRRAGRGFRYADEYGGPLADGQVQRVRDLVIPPAWRDVWICPDPRGHLQATGLDVAGRRQYLYHPQWREKRDRLKFDRVAAAARRLPQARTEVAADLARAGMPLERAAATAVRLLDLGCFRIGSDCYADANGSYGLTTLERRHARLRGGGLAFRFVGKSGVEHRVVVDDPEVVAAVRAMRRRRGGERLLAYRNGSGWADLPAALVNEYLAELLGGDFTAKDFRTWHATVLAAESLALSAEPGTSSASRKRAERAAVAEVAEYLGNTVAVARASYVDPRVIDRYESGSTIAAVASRRYASAEARRAALEAAVLDLLA
ncbi:MAG: DNA topoisomerase IB [Actinobacteria bacterium]|nr:DNA topoisomerase IB [Actinomycetota bacterium]